METWSANGYQLREASSAISIPKRKTCMALWGCKWGGSSKAGVKANVEGQHHRIKASSPPNGRRSRCMPMQSRKTSSQI